MPPPPPDQADSAQAPLEFVRWVPPTLSTYGEAAGYHTPLLSSLASRRRPRRSPLDGYHGLYPVDAEYAAGYGQRLNRACAPLVANGFIPVAAGVAPDAPPGPGFDTTQVLVAMTDWDNSNQADCRIDAIARAFPRALLYYELPHGEYFPKPDACSQVKPDKTNGRAWLRSVRQRQPRFVGVVYETDDPGKGVAQAIDEVATAHAF